MLQHVGLGSAEFAARETAVKLVLSLADAVGGGVEATEAAIGALLVLARGSKEGRELIVSQGGLRFSARALAEFSDPAITRAAAEVAAELAEDDATKMAVKAANVALERAPAALRRRIRILLDPKPDSFSSLFTWRAPTGREPVLGQGQIVSKRARRRAQRFVDIARHRLIDSGAEFDDRDVEEPQAPAPPMLVLGDDGTRPLPALDAESDSASDPRSETPSELSCTVERCSRAARRASLT